MRPPIALFAAFAAVSALCGCSSLKMASLQDARVLPPGGFAISGEVASAYSQDHALIVAGRKSDTAIGNEWERDTSFRYNTLQLVPMAGTSFAFGAGGGWELGFGGDIAPFGEESWSLDAYAKKRVYAGDGRFLTLFTRGSFGNSVGYLDAASGILLDITSGYRYVTHTSGLDFQAMYLGRLARKLGYYCNAGPYLGMIAYELQGRGGRPDQSGSVGIYGLRTHVGMVFELRHFELAWETGLQVFNFGMTPSLGVRAAFKNDWRR
jgi:hypothetical protein